MANIIIIGGGVSGLSAGIYAQLNGHSATIYEKHFNAGGNLTGWDRNGYHIDNCIHWLTGTNPLTSTYKTWVELGALGDVEVYQGETLYTFEKDGYRLSLGQSVDRLKEDMLRISPEDEKEILSLIKAVTAFQRLNGIAGKKNDEESTSLQKLLSVPRIVKYFWLSIGDLANRFQHPVLKGFLTSFMTDYFGAWALILVFATFTSGNGGIPAGSSCSMAERMTSRFLSLGGKLKLGKSVSRINTKNEIAQSVTLDDGTTQTADYIIVATDPAVAFNELLDKKMMPKSLKRQYEDPKLCRFSSYHCAFACDVKDLSFHADVMVEIPENYRDILAGDYLLLREFSHEKSYAPDGKNLLQTMIYCKEDEAIHFIQLRADPDAYKERKRDIADAARQLITERFPELKGKVACIDVWTPATYHRYVGSEIGSWMGFALPAKTLPKKISNRVKGLKNVILATQWLQAPGGLPIAASSGKRAIETIEKCEIKAKKP